MKRLALLLLVAVMLLASCAPAQTPGDETTTPPDTTASPVTTGTPETTVPETTAEPVFVSILDLERTEALTTEFSSDKIKVSDIDKKYLPKTDAAYTYVDIEAPYMSISGFPFAQTNTLKYYRLDYALYKQYPAGSGDSVQGLAHDSAGGRVRFKTDADKISVNVALTSIGRMNHMPDTGTSGCDVYVGTGANPVWVGTIHPGTSGETYNKEIALPAGTKEVMIVLPLYSGIKTMSIGFPADASVSSPDPYLIQDPVVYYGSSITQGACASRPGMSYTDITTRMLGANLVNLGFSSSAKGETIVAETIARIKMSAFVYDYDHNGDIANLRKTHYDFYKVIRQAQPDVPIIMISRFSWGYSDSDDALNQRRDIIKTTYKKAVAEGDKNVYFIDGADVYPKEYRGACLVDGTHPNDLGMYFVANAIYPVLKDALTKAGYIK